MTGTEPHESNPRAMTPEDRAIWQSGPCRYEDYELEMQFNDHKAREAALMHERGIGIAEHERNCIAAIIAVPGEGLRSWRIY